MAGVGIRLNRIYEKKSIAAGFWGFLYSIAVTIAPILLVIGTIQLMGYVLGFGKVDYLTRELFSCTVLYIFIFGLLSVSPFHAVLSRYMQDVIYEERFSDILPCYDLGLVMTIVLGCLPGIPFCLWEHFAGGVGVFYVFTGYCGYISMIFVFYSMICLSACKDYERISIFFFLGMLAAFLLSVVLRFLIRRGITESMLFALMTGFLLTGVLERAAVRRYFPGNSRRYLPVLRYFGKWWKLVAANSAYILGLYIHNFIFWTDDSRMVIARSFVCNQSYDMATCIAMFTNLSATMIFITRVERYFHEKYRLYSESVIGGKRTDIVNAKNRMFRQLGIELMNLVRVQFIISVILYLLCVIILPRFGFAGRVMRIYPCLAAGYFILFLMYSAVLFLYYFNDLTGAVFTTLSFCILTCIGSMFAVNLPEIWYGTGLVLGSFAGWTVAYMRLRWVERHLDTHTFCQGQLIRRESGMKPPGKVYERER